MVSRNAVALHVTLDDRTVKGKINALNETLNKLTEGKYTISFQLKGSTEKTIQKRADAIRSLANAVFMVSKLSGGAVSGISNLGAVTKELGANARTAQTNVKKLGDTFQGASKKQAEFNKQLDNSYNGLSRVQSLITGIAFGAFVRGIGSALTELKNVDTELVTIQKVTGQTRQEVQELADASFSVAAKYGAIASDYLSSVSSFARAGYQEQAEALGELSMMTQKVGDVSADVADQFLLSVDAAYQYKGSIQELTKVLDGANEIGNRFATDVNKITAGLGIVSNVAKQANVDIDEVTAALGTITAVTQRSGSEAARALRAIYLNIAADISTEVNEDTGDHWTAEEIEALSSSLQKFGIYTRYVKDGVEQLRNPMEVIGEIADKVKNKLISEVELNDLLQGLGGKLRSNQLLALINNWDMYERMLDTYRTSAGSAEKELGIYLDSWEAKAAKLQATWAELVNNTVNSETIKWLIDHATTALDAADNLFTLTSALGGLLVLLNSNKLASAFSGFGKMFGGIFGGTATGGTLAFGWAGAIATAIGLFATWIGYVKDKQEEQREETYKSSQAIEENRKKANEAYDSYKKLRGELEEVRKTTGKLSSDEQVALAQSAKDVAAAFGIEEEVIEALAEKLGDYDLAVDKAVEASKLSNLDNELETTESAMKAALDELQGYYKNHPLYNFANDVALGLDALFGESGAAQSGDRIRNIGQEAARVINYFEGLQQKQAELIADGKVNTEEYNKLQNEIADTAKYVDIITEAYFNNLRARYEKQQNDIVDTREEYEKFILWLKGETGSGLQSGLLGQLGALGDVDTDTPLTKAILRITEGLYDFSEEGKKANQIIEELGGHDAAVIKLKQIGDELNRLTNGNVNYNTRPYVTGEAMRNAGWSDFTGDVATTYSSAATVGNYTISFTPILSNGTVLSPEALEDYIHSLVTNGSLKDLLKSDTLNLVIDVQEGEYDEEWWEEHEENLQTLKDKHEELASALGLLSSTFGEDFADALRGAHGATVDYAGAIDGLVTKFTDFQSKYTSLETAITEFNENGYLTASTFKTLMDNDLLKYLDDVDGKLVLNEEALLNDAEAARQKAEEDIRAAWAADLLAYAEGRIGDMSAGAQGALSGFAGALSTAGGSAEKAAGQIMEAAAAVATAKHALSTTDDRAAFTQGAEQINSYYQSIISGLNKVKIAPTSTGRRGGGGGGGGSSRSTEKSNTYIDVLKAMLEDADYQVEAWTRDGNKEEAILAMYDREMREIEAIIAKYREQGYDDTSDEIQELQKLWWKYADAVEDVHEDLAKRVQDTWKELEGQVNDMVGGRTDELDEQLDELEDKYDKLLEELETAYDEQVDALETARDTEQEQLDLEEKRLAVLEAQQALLAAQNDRTVRKYNADGTWEWVADERAIQSAQEALTSAEQDLADYEADLALNATKEALKAEYEANKAALEAERDEQIAAVEAEKEAFETEWNAIKDAIVEPGRDIGEILSEIATNGTPAMKEQVDNITALLGKLGYDVAAVAGTTYGGTVSSEDSERIKKFLTGDYSGAVFDSGGVAGMKGIMLKDTSDAETVLPPSLTKAIISPERNALFSNFTDALTRMFGISERVNLGATPIPNSFGGRDSHDTSYTINGIRIGSDEAQRPFYEVMRHIAVYSNMN